MAPNVGHEDKTANKMADKAVVKGRRGRKKKTTSEPESEPNLNLDEIFNTETLDNEEQEPNTNASAVEDYNIPRHNLIYDSPTGVPIREEIRRAINTELQEEIRKMKIKMQKMRVEHRNFNDWFSAMDLKIESTKSQLREEIEDSEIRLQGEMRGQLEDMHNSSESKFKIIKERLDNTYAKALEVNEKVIQLSGDRIESIGERQSTLKNRIQSLERAQTGIRPLRSQNTNTLNPLRFNTKTPLFTEGNSPMKFIEELKSFWTMIRPGDEETPFILSNSLKGPAKDWWDLVREQDDGLEEFCSKFKRRYWGEITQHNVRTKLEFGHHTPTDENPMVDYALDLYRQAKYLNPPPSSFEIIRKLSRHFTEEIRVCILSRSINNLEDFIELLETFDKTGQINSKRKDASENKPQIDNWRNKKIENEKGPAPKREFKPQENWRNNDRTRSYPLRNPRNVNTLEIEEEKIVEDTQNQEQEN